MIQSLGMSLAAALLFAIVTWSANAQSKAKGAEMSPWTVTHSGNPNYQKKTGALKAKNAKPKVSGEVFVKLPGAATSNRRPKLKSRD